MKFIKNKKKISFITTTRVDFGKLKSLIKILETGKKFEFYSINYQSK
jgi:UDP-N-acetylglucosamine 2-epimerase